MRLIAFNEGWDKYPRLKFCVALAIPIPVFFYLSFGTRRRNYRVWWKFSEGWNKEVFP